MGKEKVKLWLFMNDMILYVKLLRNQTNKQKKPYWNYQYEFSKFVEHNIYSVYNCTPM